MSATCSAPGCDKAVERTPGRVGRPPIYCCPGCRPSKRRSRLTIEIDHDATDDAETGRDWVVRLRRGQRAVVLREGLGRFSAATFAAELRALISATIDDHRP